jgi:hypothetical protein
MMKKEDCVCLYEGVTYLWLNDEAVPIKEEEVQGFIDAGAPIFKFLNNEIVPLT